MRVRGAILLFLLAGRELVSQTPARRPLFEEFEVATIKPTPPDWRGGRYFRMTSPQRFFAPNFTTKFLIAAAYSITPQMVLGGAEWLDSDHYDIAAATPGDVRPNLEEQMSMLRKLLTDRFALAFHREEREFPVYSLSVARNGAKLKESTRTPDEPPELLNQIFPGEGVRLPARNITMAQFTAMMQRTIFNRPVLDRTGLSGRYDFDLEWTPDESQFDGLLKELPAATKPGIFTALQEQLGLRLEAGRGRVQALIIDHIERPSEN